MQNLLFELCVFCLFAQSELMWLKIYDLTDRVHVCVFFKQSFKSHYVWKITERIWRVFCSSVIWSIWIESCSFLSPELIDEVTIICPSLILNTHTLERLLTCWLSQLTALQIIHTIIHLNTSDPGPLDVGTHQWKDWDTGGGHDNPQSFLPAQSGTVFQEYLHKTKRLNPSSPCATMGKKKESGWISMFLRSSRGLFDDNLCWYSANHTNTALHSSGILDILFPPAMGGTIQIPGWSHSYQRGRLKGLEEI